MNYDQMSLQYASAYTETDFFKQAIEGQKSKKEILADISNFSKIIKKHCDTFMKGDETVYFDNINYIIDQENEERANNYSKNKENPLEHFKAIPKKEQSKRKDQMKKAAKIATQGIINCFEKQAAFDSANPNLKDRSTKSALLGMCKNKEEAYDIGLRVAHINEGNNREYLKNFILKGIAEGKELCKQMLNVKNEDQLIDFMSKKYGPFQMLAEMQGNNMYEFNKLLNVGIPEDVIEDWKHNYSNFAVDTLTMRCKLQSMANPLYPELNSDDVPFIYDLDLKYFNNPFTTGHENNYSVENFYVNPFADLDYYASFMQSVQFSINNKAGDTNKDKKQYIEDTLKFRLFSIGLDSNLDNYQFYDLNGNKVKNNEALVKMTSGEEFTLRKDGNFIYKLNMEKDFFPGYVLPTNGVTPFKLREAFGKNKSKDKTILDDLKKAKDSLATEVDPKKKAKLEKNIAKLEGKVKDAKKDSLNNVNKSLNSSLKDLYKEVKSHNPWYIKNRKGNKTYTDVQNELDKLVNDKYLNLATKKSLINQIKDKAQSYLTDRANNTGRKMNKNALDREKAMMQVLHSLIPVEKEIENVLSDAKVYDNALNKNEPIINNDLVKNLEADLENEMIINTSKSKNNEKSKVVDDSLEINTNISDAKHKRAKAKSLDDSLLIDLNQEFKEERIMKEYSKEERELDEKTRQFEEELKKEQNSGKKFEPHFIPEDEDPYFGKK